MNWESVLIQYLFYGGIFILGLVILFLMKQKDKKPVSVIALTKTDALIKKTDKLLENCADIKKYNVYTLIAKTLRLSNEIGDLVVLMENEVNNKRNISYDGALSAYQAAAKLSGEIDITYDSERTVNALTDTRTALEQAKSLIASLSDKKRQ